MIGTDLFWKLLWGLLAFVFVVEGEIIVEGNGLFLFLLGLFFRVDCRWELCILIFGFEGLASIVDFVVNYIFQFFLLLPPLSIVVVLLLVLLPWKKLVDFLGHDIPVIFLLLVAFGQFHQDINGIALYFHVLAERWAGWGWWFGSVELLGSVYLGDCGGVIHGFLFGGGYWGRGQDL